MTEKEIEKALDKYFKKKSELYNKIITEKNTYKKVEDMLRYYNRFKRRIIFIENNMDNIILKKASGISELSSGSFTYKSDLEKKEDIREQNQKLINKYQAIIDLVDCALSEIKDDEYFKVIELRYFEKKNNEEISEELNIGMTSVKRHRNRLVYDLCEIIFPEEVLEKIF